jgi:hypothetical protein
MRGYAHYNNFPDSVVRGGAAKNWRPHSATKTKKAI